jgi:hypothetical protein
VRSHPSPVRWYAVPSPIGNAARMFMWDDTGLCVTKRASLV